MCRAPGGHLEYCCPAQLCSRPGLATCYKAGTQCCLPTLTFLKSWILSHCLQHFYAMIQNLFWAVESVCRHPQHCQYVLVGYDKLQDNLEILKSSKIAARFWKNWIKLISLSQSDSLQNVIADFCSGGFAVWEALKKYRELELRPLGNVSSPFCRTECFHLHVKIVFIHLSVWLIGQGDWKFHSRPGFDSWQFVAQAEKCRWAGNWNFLTFFNLIF